MACCSIQGIECSSACIGPFEGGQLYLHYLHHSLASGQITGREHSLPIPHKIGLKIYRAQHIKTRPSFLLSQSLLSGSFLKPLILLYQRTDRLKTKSNCLTLVTPLTASHQSFQSITSFQSLLKLTSIESVTPSNHLILCHPLLLPPSIFPSIRVFSKESVLHIMWPKYWSFSFSIRPSNEHSGLISFRMD